MAADDRDDPAEPAAQEPTADETSPATERPGTDETREQPLSDASAAQTQDRIPSDPWAQTEIRPVPPDEPGPAALAPGGTSILPPVDAGGPGEPGTPRWSARAQVPTRDVEEEVHEAWAEPPRGPIVPILVAVCILLLIALFGLGTWLIFANRPATSPTARPTVQTATPPPSTNTRVTTSTSPVPEEVALPDLRGQSYDKAAETLTKLGFVPVRNDVLDATVPKGKVIGTDPPAGTKVRPGPNVKITVFVSTGLPDVTSPPPSTSHA